MEELNKKLLELSKKLEEINILITDVEEHIQNLKKDKCDYLYWEEEFYRIRENKKNIENKIQTLKDARDVLTEK